MDIYDGDLAEEFEKTSATHIVQWGKKMKNNLPTFTFCGKVQGFEEPCSFLQIFVGLYWTGQETRRQIAKEKMRIKEKQRKRN